MTVWFILRAASGHRMREAAAAGGLVGALLLIGPVAAIVACATAGPLAVHRTLRAPQIVLAVGVAAVVTGVWTGPMVLDYLDLGGFVRTDPRTSVTAAHAVVGMGVPALLGAAGLLFLLLARRADVDIPALVVLAGVPALFCLATGVLPGHTIGGIAPALRLQRYLPFLALALTLPAGWGVAEILGRLHRWPGTIVAIVLLSTSTASTLLTGLGLRDMFDRAPRLALVCENGPQVRAGQVVAVAGLDEPDTREVDDEVFRSTGAWVLWREEPRLRYREIFTRIATQQQRHAATENLTDGVVPSDVDWILFPRDAPSPTGLQPVAACRAALSTHRTADFRLYRPPALD
jgi:hypothetical protein